MSRANGKFSRREFDQSAMDANRDGKPVTVRNPWAGEVSGNVDGPQDHAGDGLTAKFASMVHTVFTPKGG